MKEIDWRRFFRGWIYIGLLIWVYRETGYASVVAFFLVQLSFIEALFKWNKINSDNISNVAHNCFNQFIALGNHVRSLEQCLSESSTNTNENDNSNLIATSNDSFRGADGLKESPPE